MSARGVGWGVRFADGSVDTFDTRTQCLAHISRLEAEDGDCEIVISYHAPWIAETEGTTLTSLLPETECRNCKGTKLGFEVSVSSPTPGVSTHGIPEFYQGCLDCSETLWVGDWNLFHAVLALIYDIRIPRLD
jgi:hypothetical protein